MASSSYSGLESEVVTLEEAGKGSRLELHSSLRYNHSVSRLQTTAGIGFGTEIGALGRSIMISGDELYAQGAFIDIQGNSSAVLLNTACVTCGRVMR